MLVNELLLRGQNVGEPGLRPVLINTRIPRGTSLLPSNSVISTCILCSYASKMMKERRRERRKNDDDPCT
jgi:hypothetical protein